MDNFPFCNKDLNVLLVGGNSAAEVKSVVGKQNCKVYRIGINKFLTRILFILLFSVPQ
jgi:hypothetical protein